ncbi:hypothetical protein GOP47_0015356 [Adiantum capillus-veneris]|uniref:Uncharacterized protein n=1 Tax=Adiantum capillus-veneris TaxID=13818 RepID=A0A9D4ZD46_ADICA|nr:hypothetical protein GOP47_0015356 [Adiantum capillus-veneris]
MYATSTTTTLLAMGEKIPDPHLPTSIRKAKCRPSLWKILTRARIPTFSLPSWYRCPFMPMGIGTIACDVMNDGFVMRAWGEHLDVDDNVLVLSNGNRVFTQSIGVTLD